MFKLPDLDYSYGSLGVSLSEELMQLHHGKHHQTYVDKLNVAVESSEIAQNKSIEDLLVNVSSLPEPLQTSIRNMGGGHYNHSLFWKCISPNGGGEPGGKIAELLIGKWGSYQKFVEEFTTKSLGLFGSGWVWLQPNGDIITTQNQDTPIAKGLDSPILCLDVWEHAYYLDYKNRRDEYVKAWWSIVDWESASDRYDSYLLNRTI